MSSSIELIISEDRIKEVEGIIGLEQLQSMKDKFGDEAFAIAIALHTSKASKLLVVKEALTFLGWKEAAVAISAETTEKEEEVPTEFEVNIKSIKADKKIVAIKKIREMMGLGLKEAKDIVDSVEKGTVALKSGLEKSVADAIAKDLEEIGEIEVRGMWFYHVTIFNMMTFWTRMLNIKNLYWIFVFGILNKGHYIYDIYDIWKKDFL